MKTEEQSNNAGSDNLTARRSLVTGVGVAVAGLAASAVSPRADAQSRRRRDDFEPARHELDAWLGEASGSHRIFVDSASTQGGTDAVLYATNVFNAHINAYAGQASDLAVVICFRHLSTPFGFGNATWEKYGAAIQRVLQSQEGGPPAPVPTANPMNGSGPGMNIGGITARGAQFAICSNATRFFAGQLSAGTGSSADEIYDEIVAGAIPNSRFVPAGVMTLTRAQEYGYSLLYAG